MSPITPEETVTSELIYSGNVVSLRKDTVKTGRGQLAEREIIEHAPVVVMIPVTADNRLMMLRQYRTPVGEELLELPAGGVDGNETLEDAVRREMVEETGFEPATIDFVTTIYPSPGISNERMHLFRVSDLRGDGKPTEPADELEVEIVTVEDARAMVMDGRIRDAKSAVGILILDSQFP